MLIFKNTRRKIGNIVSEINLSSTFTRMIGNRDSNDKLILLFLTIFLIIFIFFLKYYVKPYIFG